MADRIDVRIEGAERLAIVAGAIQRQVPELRKDLLRGLRAAAKPTVKDIKETARVTLPKRGGLNDWVAKSSIGLRTRTSGENSGIRIEGRKTGHDVKSLDAGRLRHPLFGNRKRWFQQDIRPGFFSQTITRHDEEIRTEIYRTLDQWVDELNRRASK